ncbi:Hypothetical predicted protein [Octopus vulgaris]|uniref:Uncharacterized protein n=1 Tax=Octopus vulgaris TaxID=6645 RepID=A0AA36BUU2_OCTVU|nr:Hypothetical predicted protein [Octopus vulgaris]
MIWFYLQEHLYHHHHHHHHHCHHLHHYCTSTSTTTTCSYEGVNFCSDNLQETTFKGQLVALNLDICFKMKSLPSYHLMKIGR